MLSNRSKDDCHAIVSNLAFSPGINALSNCQVTQSISFSKTDVERFFSGKSTQLLFFVHASTYAILTAFEDPMTGKPSWTETAKLKTAHC